MIHGVLHLAGYKDKKPAEKALMRKKEEACLSLRK
jgi:ssRNA-specific RNase YbeY (16S rRNA maturation enzyme)